MKSKKLFLPIVILAVAILLTVAYSLISSIAKKPTITEKEFPFSITYELDGKIITIDDVYRARYVKNDGYADTKGRIYVGEIGDMGEDNTVYTLKKEKQTRVELCTFFYPDYMMGDSEYDYFDDTAFAPQLYYYDAEEQEFNDAETLSAHGVKLISYEYPTPIENSFVFSHLSYFSGAVVFPALLIALLALAAMILFVKKDTELNYTVVDKVSIVCNFAISFTLLPFVTVAASLIDINGGGPELYRQILYFIPSLIVLCIAASVALRRKGYGTKSLVAQLVAPAFFVVYYVFCAISELL